MKKMVQNAFLFMTGCLFLTACSSSNRLMDVSANEAKNMTESWPAMPRQAVETMIAKYGNPTEITSTMVIWKNNGPWKKTVIYKEEIPHDFPMAHTDFVQQTIEYKVPLGKYDELARYDGSVIVERTKGTMSARCDKEEMNFLALNLAHDVATGQKTVHQAREYYAMAAMKFKQGGTDPYLQKLQFTPPSNAKDPDMPAKM